MSVVAFRDFLRAQNKNENTIKAYCLSARMILQSSRKPVKQTTEADVVSLLNSLSNLSTRARHLYGLKSFFGFLNMPVTQRIQSFSAERALDWWLKPEDIIRIIQACSLPRDRAAIGLGYTCALRNGELASLSRSDVDREQLLLKVRSEKKRGRIRVAMVPLYQSTLELVDAYLGTRIDPNEALLLNYKGERLSPTGISEVVRRALIRAGIRAPAGCRNLLRHARASHLRLQGVPLEDIRQLLRHERLETSLIYSHIGVNDLAKRIPEPVLYLPTEVALPA